MTGKKALIIEDSPTQAQLIEIILNDAELSVTVAKTGQEGLEKGLEIDPDVIVLDIVLPDLDGFTVCRRLRQTLRHYVPILMLTARDETDDRVDGLELGADDYMVKPVEGREFVARIKALLRIKSLHDELQMMLEKERQSLKVLKKVALVDHLTEVYNRHYLSEVLAAEFEKARRYGQPLSCIMLDVDHFKDFNTRYGHDIGDWVLQEVAAILKDNVRHADVVARYGGDEFVIVQPMTEEKDAAKIAERLCRMVSEKQWESRAGILDIRISLGVASTAGNGVSSADDLVKAADKALFNSKEQGRNTVCRYSSP